jgi:hypothetical protein
MVVRVVNALKVIIVVRLQIYNKNNLLNHYNLYNNFNLYNYYNAYALNQLYLTILPNVLSISKVNFFQTVIYDKSSIMVKAYGLQTIANRNGSVALMHQVLPEIYFVVFKAIGS